MPGKLKPCPFCGGEAEVALSGKTYFDDTIKGFIVVRCTACAASIKGAFYQGPIVEVTEESRGALRAVANWNWRVKAKEL